MIKVEQNDITKLKVYVIVNAANKSLLGGGGVDGAIHAAAGPQLLEECRKLNGCETGEAKITLGYNLPAQYIIHTVGPIYRFHSKKEAKELLANCYQNSLDLAKKKKLNSIAFSCISTGVYGYPKSEAAKIAVDTVKEWLSKTRYSLNIIFCTFDAENKQIYQKLL